MSRKVLIGGGTGFIGSTLKQLMQKKGYMVIVVSRTAGRDRLTWNDVAQNGIPDNTFAVVNLAGENVLNPFRRFTENFKKEIIDSRLNTTNLLAHAVRDANVKPKVFVSMSGVGIYKPDKAKVYDENTDVGECFDFISRLAHDWEKASETSDDVRRVILRSGVVLGRSGGMIKEVYLQFFVGLGVWFSSGSQYFPWIHLHDLCRLIVFSIEHDEVKGVLNAVAPEVITNKTFAKTFARAMWKPAFLSMPGFICKLIFGAERSVMILEGQQVIPHKAVDVYNFSYLYPSIEKACAELAPFRYTPPSLTY